VEVVDVPVVTATTNNGSATAVVTDATAVPGITNVIVTSSNQEATKTYTVNLVEVGTDATLSDLKLDGVTIEGFDANTLDYTFEVPAESTVVPVITATTNSELATLVVNDAAAVPGITEIVVTSEDASNTITYTVSFTKTGIDATLSDLKVDGNTVAGFDASVLDYTVKLPSATTIVPTVTATTTEATANAVVTDASALPGTTDIVVTSGNTLVTSIYSVSFVKQSDDATLSDLQIDGVTVNGFSASTLSYAVELPIGTTVVPSITVTTNDALASAVVTSATSLPGTSNIVVTAEDATITETYSVVFSIMTKDDQEILFEDIANVSLDEATIILEATATSGLPVSLSSTSDKITIDGQNVSLLSAGRVSVTANQAGNTSFEAAAAVEQSFCINPIKPVVTANVESDESIILSSSSSVGNQWFVNGTLIANATASTYETSEIGNYTVKVRVDDCVSPISDELSLVVTDLNDLGEGILVYPNPVENSFKLIGITEEIKDYQLVSVSGKMYQIQLTERDGAYTADISNLSNGVYILNVRLESQTLQFRIIKD
jgi:hypothetical protein